ncbi:MAG: SusC/RagA family TonB-linked outer membrane protein [Chitinophagaceae bacterium]|nr:SusC/RagA family TonB-linked outer membrane protein [Chitinophagaceae bacterium]
MRKCYLNIRSYCLLTSLLVVVNASIAKDVNVPTGSSERNNAPSLKTGLPYADFVVKGTVRDENGIMVGVTVTEKGTVNATTTDKQGGFSLSVKNANSVLLFTSVGYKTLEVAVKGQKDITVTLEKDAQELSGVVVTALGITREKKSLGYSVEEVAGKEMVRVPQENILTAMAGKVAGVTINQTSGVGSSVSMVIRGATSLNNDNQPLIVVDGTPLNNTINNISQVNGKDNRVDYGNSISSINPDDIENISVLKGPSAAALYGARAGNGVILITTKSGAKAQKLTVNAYTNTVFDKPYRFLKVQTKFGPGQVSAIPVSVSGNPLTNPFGVLVQDWINGYYGAELDKGYEEVQWNNPVGDDGKQIATPLVSHPNNVKNFVETGITSINGVSVANNNNLVSYRLSYSNMQNKGIVPNSDLFRNTFNIAAGIKASKNFKISTNLDLSRNNSNNRPAGERGANPLQWAYAVAPNTDIRVMKDYWMPGQEGYLQKSQDAARLAASGKPPTFNNPYFLAYEINNGFVRDRVFGNIRADWQISRDFSFMARYSLDNLSEQRETKLGRSYSEDPYGGYGLMNINNFENNADFLLTYKKGLKDFNLSVSGGGNHRYQNGSNASTSSINGLITPGVYSLSNIAMGNLVASSYRFEKAVNSLYGFLNLSYKDYLFLDVSGRNDWSSTLPDAAGYFYPSASLSILLNEMLGMPSYVNLFKLRGGVAQVGNDTEPYKLLSMLQNAGTFAGVPQLTTSAVLQNAQLKPELARSYEGGIDITMYGGRLRFAGTYYMVENKNQILNTLIPPSSGYTQKNINAGLLRSKGVEMTFGITPIANKNLRWDVNLNFTRNRTRLIELSDELPYFTLWNEAKGGSWTYVGDEMGDIYDAQIVTVTDKSSPYYGYPILDNTGKWQSIDAVNTKNKVGNYNPRFIMGAQTSLTYKGFSLSLTFDWRNGGDFMSQTYRYMEEGGLSQMAYDKLINPGNLQGRELRDYLVANQDKMILPNGNTLPLVGGPTPEYNSFPFVYGPYTVPYGGVLIPGVYLDDQGQYVENLGENIGQPGGSKTLPLAGATPWSFTRTATFDASYLKLREVSLGYTLPQKIAQRMKMQDVNISVYSRNIMLWTAAKINIDPENAFQPRIGDNRGGMQFAQGIERYNVYPWVIPVGFKVSVTF